jgi:hypothetical protein
METKSNILTEIFDGLKDAAIEQNHLFFTDENPHAYFSKAGLVTYVRSHKNERWRIAHLKQLFDNISLNRNLNNFPEISLDDKGQEVIWCTFKVGNVTQHLCIKNGGRIYDFINDYALKRAKFPFTLETLLEEAEQAVGNNNDGKENN